jgi:uncharacterized protein YjbI with pentapeptide repeats
MECVTLLVRLVDDANNRKVTLVVPSTMPLTAVCERLEKEAEALGTSFVLSLEGRALAPAQTVQQAYAGRPYAVVMDARAVQKMGEKKEVKQAAVQGEAKEAPPYATPCGPSPNPSQDDASAGGPVGVLPPHRGCVVANQGKLDEELRCKICAQPCLDAAVLPCCEHLVCRGCLRDTLCPFDRAPVAAESLKEPQRIIRNMLERVEVQCKECDRLMKRGLKGEVFAKHVQEECPVKCVWGCAEMLTRATMGRQEGFCSARVIACSAADVGCAFQCVRTALQEHESICVFVTLSKTIRGLKDEIGRLKDDAERERYRGKNWSRADFSGKNFSGYDLSNTVLTHANLSNAILSRAILRNVDLSGRDFSGCNLSYADLSHSNLSAVNFTGANLEFSNMSECNLSGTNFTDANMQSVKLSKSNFGSAMLTGVSFRGANLSGLDFSNCDLSEADFTLCDLSNCSFANAVLSRCDFTQANMKGCVVVGAIGWKWCYKKGYDEMFFRLDDGLYLYSSKGAAGEYVAPSNQSLSKVAVPEYVFDVAGKGKFFVCKNEVYACGANLFGVLGLGVSDTSVSTPTKVAAVSGKKIFTIVVKNNNSYWFGEDAIYICGEGSHGAPPLYSPTVLEKLPQKALAVATWKGGVCISCTDEVRFFNLDKDRSRPAKGLAGQKVLSLYSSYQPVCFCLSGVFSDTGSWRNVGKGQHKVWNVCEKEYYYGVCLRDDGLFVMRYGSDVEFIKVEFFASKRVTAVHRVSKRILVVCDCGVYQLGEKAAYCFGKGREVEEFLWTCLKDKKLLGVGSDGDSRPMFVCADGLYIRDKLVKTDLKLPFF